MNKHDQLTNESLLHLIGERVAGLRLARNLTQGQLAEQAGLGLRTVQRMESGASATQLTGFLRVCRVLGILDRIDLLLPEPAPSPLDQLKMQGRKRQRATGERAKPEPTKKWTWGEDA